MFLPDVTYIRSPTTLAPVVSPTSCLIEPRYSTFVDITASGRAPRPRGDGGGEQGEAWRGRQSGESSHRAGDTQTTRARTCGSRRAPPAARPRGSPARGPGPRRRSSAAAAAGSRSPCSPQPSRSRPARGPRRSRPRRARGPASVSRSRTISSASIGPSPRTSPIAVDARRHAIQRGARPRAQGRGGCLERWRRDRLEHHVGRRAGRPGCRRTCRRARRGATASITRRGR